MSIRRLVANNKGVLLPLREWPILAKAGFFIIILNVIVFTAVILISSQVMRKSLLTKSLAQLQQTSQSEAIRLAGQLDRNVAKLESLAASASVQDQFQTQSESRVLPTIDEFQLQTPGVETVGLVSLDGDVVAIAPTSASTTSIVAESGWFERAKQDAFVGGLLEDNDLTNTEGVLIAVPISHTGTSQLVGVLYAVFDPRIFYPELDQELVVYLSDSSPIIARPGVRTLLSDHVSAQIHSDPIGSIVDSSLSRAYGYSHFNELGIEDSPASSLDWVVTVQQPLSLLQAQIRSEVSPTLELIGLGMLLSCLGIIGISYLLFRPVIRLTTSVEHLLESDYLDTEIPTHPAYELTILGSGFGKLLRLLRHRASQFNAAAEISRESVTQDLNLLMDRTARTLYERLNLSAVYIYQTVPDDLRIRLAVSYSTPGELDLKPGNSIILSDSTIVGRALLAKKTQWYKGLKSSFRGKKDEPAEIAIPFGGSISGVVHIIGEADEFSQVDVSIFELIANELSAIIDNHQLIEQTDLAREDAEKANQVKSQFLAAMSHELRTPLNSIINFSLFVVQGAVGAINEKQEELLKMVVNSSEHLLSLINDVLDISKIESGSLDLLVDENVNLTKILNDVVTTGKGLLGEKPVQFVLDIEDLPLIVADQRRVRQIMLNVVSNACKFTKEGSITIMAHQQDDEIQIMIRDSGPGIAPEEHNAVFETFRQTDVGLAHGGGTGLGMPISKRLAEAHGGRMWLESAIGEGAAFYVALPIQSEHLLEKVYRKPA